jgi:serine protease AprX
MPITLLVTVQSDDEDAAIRETGAEVLAQYPDSMLVRGTDEQTRAVTELGVQATSLAEQPVVTNGNSFAFADAVQAQDAVAVEPLSGRTAYYLLRLAGPPAYDWLRELQGHGAQVHDSLPGYTLLVGVLPERVAELRTQPWVEDVTPYRPAMKVSPKFATGVRRDLGIDALATAADVGDDEGGDRPQLVEVSVFPGESVQDLAAQVRDSGGTVLETTGRVVVANMPTGAVVRLADLPGVQAILPYALPEMHNDQARLVLQVPPDNTVAGHRLTGTDQIVAIADTGLDTGDPATVHADVRGRVKGIVSWPTNTVRAPYVRNPPGSDDGPADPDSGHGTHVTGSVLGNGKAALNAASTPVPTGVAPEARVFFQAIGQKLDWKTADEVRAAGLATFGPSWPPDAASLWGLPSDLRLLFQEAYEAGARIHTNSWGAAVSGDYNSNAQLVDDFAWRHPDMLILFSAGNSGADVDADGVIDADSVGSPGTAKNCLTVGAGENNRPAGSDPKPGIDGRWDERKGADGALRWPHLDKAGHVSDNVDGMAAFSSRGPTNDGRIKPDVVAPGTNVLSMLSSKIPPDAKVLHGRLPEGHPLRALYVWSGGTSMSTPLVAGAAALIRQHLVRNLQHRPSAALLKAFLINGAVSMAGQFPGEIPEGSNIISGFGRVDVGRSIAPGPRHQTLFADEAGDAVQTGQKRIYQIEAVDPAAPLKVTLVWTDAPSLEGNGGLVNQLYLQVQAPDGHVHHGDVVAFPAAVNNVQQVAIAAPAAGNYEIRVWGVSVTELAPRVAQSGIPRQDFAITVANGEALTKVR